MVAQSSIARLAIQTIILPLLDALELLCDKGHPTEALRSKSWDEFSGADKPAMHAVITVCDNAKGESCPVMPGHPMQVHWGIPDPAGAGVDGAIEDFELAYARLAARVEALLALDEEALSPREWRDALMAIGREGEGATGHE